MSFYILLLHVHSTLRWILLIFLIYTIVMAFIKWRSSAVFSKPDLRITTLTVSIAHLQLLFGIGLYFLSPKVLFAGEAMSSPILRFFTVEHSLMMIIAVALLTIGNVSAKKALTDKAKAKRIFIWFLIALIVIIKAIPWPSKGLGSGWM
jgi:hypothetical protein